MRFLTRRLFRFVLLVVVPPLLGAIALEVSDRLEARNGATHLTVGLRQAGRLLRRWSLPT
jgi:hypothetical protein